MLVIPDSELAKVDWDDRAFVKERLSCLPAKAQKKLFSHYTTTPDKFARNTYLRELVDSLVSKLTVSPEKLSLSTSEDELQEEANIWWIPHCQFVEP